MRTPHDSDVPVPVPPDTRDAGTGTDSWQVAPSVAPGTLPEQQEREDRPELFFDVEGMLRDGIPEPPKPRWVQRTDAVGLFYPEQVNTVFGDPESGKSWLVLCAVAEALADGGKAVVIDLDHNGPQQTVSRLVALRVAPEVLADRDRFRYVEPEHAGHLTAIVSALTAWGPHVAMVDSVGELLPVFGLSSNSPDDFTAAHSKVLKPLAMSGSCVITIDHLAKSRESREQGPGGTFAKMRTLGGSSIRVEVREGFAPGRGGAARLSVHKDRPGGLRAACPSNAGRELYAGMFRLEALPNDELRWYVFAPEEAPDDVRPSVGPTSRGGMTLDEALAKWDGLHVKPLKATVREVRKLLECSNELAAEVVRELKARPVPVPLPPVSPGTVTGTPDSEPDPEGLF